MSNEFPCTSCGLCCKNIKSIFQDMKDPMLNFLASKFPYKMLEDGSCEMLKDNQCSVYENRPLICNVELGGKALGIKQDVWYKLMAEGCNKMIIEAGLDSKYLVSVKNDKNV